MPSDGSTLIYPEESYTIMGACFEVYKELGCGYLEAVYHDALGIEFRSRDVPAMPKVEMKIAYKGHLLTPTYVPDSVCYAKIIVELKAVSELAREHEAQLHNYLRASGWRLGLLINFGHYPQLQYKRIAL